jgi:hypothetical protein
MTRVLCLDLDAAIDPSTGQLMPWALDVLEKTRHSYAEKSPSGTGLHVWVRVLNPLPANLRPLSRAPLEAAPNTNGKRAGVQLFGLGPAGYVAVTGRWLTCTSREPEVLEDLDELFALLGMLGSEPGSGPADEMPRGDGEPPRNEEILAFVKQQPHGSDLLCGNWSSGWKSASEAFFVLAQLALRGARGHGRQALDFLLSTAWGRGEIHESRDPGKYGRREWVEREVLRVAGKTTAAMRPSDMFGEPLPPEPTSGGSGAAGASPSSAPAPWVRQNLDDVLSKPLAPWVVQHYFRSGQLGFVVAFPTVGKSTLVAAWAMSVLYGRSWCGKKAKAGSVVCLVGEGRRGFCNRLDAFRRHHQLGPIPEGRYIEIVDFRRSLSSAQGQADMRRLIETIVSERGHAPSLVIIDTLSSHWTESEDSSEFGAPAMRALADIAHANACAVVVVHHTVKAKGRFVMPELPDLRGSGVFIGNTDFVFGMCATGPNDGAVVKGLKLKDDEPPAEIKVTRVSVPCAADADGEPVTAAVFGDEAAAVGAQDTAGARSGEDLDRSVLAIVQALMTLKSATKRDAVAAQAHIGVQRGRALFDIAVSKGWIENRGSERRPRYEVTGAGRKACAPFPPSGTEEGL